MKQISFGAVLISIAFLGMLFLVTRSSESEPEQADVEGAGVVVTENQGGNMEGHTPRGFQGMGTGLFAGDNLNPGFPNGDGVQMFLTFDLSAVSFSSVSSAVLSSEYVNIQGTPFKDLGNLVVEEVRYQKFSSELWNLEAKGESCVFAVSKGGPFSCDVSGAVERSLKDGYPYAQFRLRFEKAGDGDGSQDMVSFFKRDSNTNEPGIFKLEITEVNNGGQRESADIGMNASEVIHVPVVLHIVTGNGPASSSRTSEGVLKLFESTQSIWNQANIVFDVSVEETELDARIERAVLMGSFRELYSMFPEFSKKIHIFYVRSLNGSNGIAIAPSVALVADRTTVNAFRATAHEIGHLLGLVHTRTSFSRLLYSGTNGTALFPEEIKRARLYAQGFN